MHESASHHFACTLPAQPRQTWRLQPGNQIQTACRAQTAWPGPTRLASYGKGWSTISSHFLVAVRTKALMLAAHVAEAWLWEAQADQCRLGADVQWHANVSVIFISLQNVSKCAFATNLMFLIISTNSDSNLDHFYSLDSFSMPRELI